MEVILLERIGRLGQMGDVVRVKDGYARNFLLPKGKALRDAASQVEDLVGNAEQTEAEYWPAEDQDRDIGRANRQAAMFDASGDGVQHSQAEHSVCDNQCRARDRCEISDQAPDESECGCDEKDDAGWAREVDCSQIRPGPREASGKADNFSSQPKVEHIRDRGEHGGRRRNSNDEEIKNGSRGIAARRRTGRRIDAHHALERLAKTGAEAFKIGAEAENARNDNH